MKALEHGGIASPMGFTAAGVRAGIKQSGLPDVALVAGETDLGFAAAFTDNAFASPSVEYNRELAASRSSIRALAVNSGNANACTGIDGGRDVRRVAEQVAERLGVLEDEVMVFSTGVIGVPLPMTRLLAGIDEAAALLAADGGPAAAEAIMTTDTKPKSLAVEIQVDGVPVRIGGMGKGAGMIAPRLVPAPPHATMLAFLSTDAALEPDVLDTCLRQSLDRSFNRITVDGDSSTNDSVVAVSSGLAGNSPIRTGTLEGEQFQRAFNHVAAQLARMMVEDAEGATKFVEVTVAGAKSPQEARECALAVANSTLCKTAWFGCDPNWGRVLCAAGYSGAEVSAEQTNLDYNGVPIVRHGIDAGTPAAEQAAALEPREIIIELNLGVGDAEFTVWTSDLSYDYVKINAEYHT